MESLELPQLKTIALPEPSPLGNMKSHSGTPAETERFCQKKSAPTYFAEVQAIDLCLKLVDLLELIHDRNVVHTNFCPQEIFLKEKRIHHM